MDPRLVNTAMSRARVGMYMVVDYVAALRQKNMADTVGYLTMLGAWGLVHGVDMRSAQDGKDTSPPWPDDMSAPDWFLKV